MLTRFDGRHISALDLTVNERTPVYPEPFGKQLYDALNVQLRLPRPE